MAQPTGTGREISLFIGGDSVPFRPGHGRLHQSPRIDEDTAEQWPRCGPIEKSGLPLKTTEIHSHNRTPFSVESVLIYSLEKKEIKTL